MSRCGHGPRVVDLTGEDAEIICGEWETGSFPPIESGEKYNVILDIKDVIRHPDYTVNIDSSAHIQNSNGPLIRTFAVVLGRKMKISSDLS